VAAPKSPSHLIPPYGNLDDPSASMFASYFPPEQSAIPMGASISGGARTLSCGSCETLYTNTNEFLNSARSLPASSLNFSHGLDAHIAIIGITRGWDEAGKQVWLDPQWECLVQIDQMILSRCEPIERLATIQVMRRMLKVSMLTCIFLTYAWSRKSRDIILDTIANVFAFVKILSKRSVHSRTFSKLYTIS
jgi:hypothetical protein